MNPKFTKHEPKKPERRPIPGVVYAPKKVKHTNESDFSPLLSKAEKGKVKHMTQHERVVFLRCRRLEITFAQYKALCI